LSNRPRAVDGEVGCCAGMDDGKSWLGAVHLHMCEEVHRLTRRHEDAAVIGQVSERPAEVRRVVESTPGHPGGYVVAVKGEDRAGRRPEDVCDIANRVAHPCAFGSATAPGLHE